VSSALLSPLYIGTLYFLVREITQMISVRESTTVLAYLLDPENLINLSFIFLTMYVTVLMQTGMSNDDNFAGAVAATTLFQMCQTLAYFKSILIEFAVFVSGVTFVSECAVSFSHYFKSRLCVSRLHLWPRRANGPASRLVSFLMITAITLVMFSQIW
jgi:hypothetical protein